MVDRFFEKPLILEFVESHPALYISDVSIDYFRRPAIYLFAIYFDRCDPCKCCSEM